MTEEEKEAFAELQAQVRGLTQVVAIALAQLPREAVLQGLIAAEKSFRAQNARSGMIEVVRSFREIWNQSPKDELP